jgi:hypothetical protein
MCYIPLQDQGYLKRVLTRKIIRFYESKGVKCVKSGLKLENQ